MTDYECVTSGDRKFETRRDCLPEAFEARFVHFFVPGENAIRGSINKSCAVASIITALVSLDFGRALWIFHENLC